MPLSQKLRRAVAGAALLHPAVLTSQAPAPTLKDPDIAKVYGLALKVQVMADVCINQFAAQSAGVPAAAAAWNTKHARDQLDTLIAHTSGGSRNASMARGIMRFIGPKILGPNPAEACSAFDALLATAENDVGVSDPTALRNARRKLGATELTELANATPAAGPVTSFRRPVSDVVTPPAGADSLAVLDAITQAATAAQAGVDSAAPTRTPSVPSRGARAPRRGSAAGRGSGRAPSTATVASNRDAVPSGSVQGNAGIATDTLPNPPREPTTRGPDAAPPTIPPAVRAPRQAAATASTGESPRVTSLAEVQGPAGWQKQLMNDGSVSFVIAKNDTGFATVIVSPDQPTGGAPIDTVVRNWLRANLGAKLDLEGQFKYGHIYRGITTFNQNVAYADLTPEFRNGDKGMRLVAIAIPRANGMFTPVLMVTKDDQYQYYRAIEFGRWFGKVALPGDTGTRWSLQTSARPGPLQGLWLGSRIANHFNIYGGMDLIVERSYGAFFALGLSPPSSRLAGQVDNMDLNGICVKDPTDCGTYRLEGTRLITLFPTRLGLLDADTAEVKFAQTDSTFFNLRGFPMGKLKPVRGVRLSGEFTSIEGSAVGPNGSFMRSRTITFHPDGRYESQIAVGFTSTPGGINSDNGSVVGTSTSGPNQGTYTIDGFTLTMRPSQGPVRYATLIIFDDDRPIKAVLIDDEYYKQ